MRARADWPIVAGAWLVMLLAAALFAAGFIYPSAAAEAGLRRALADASASDRNIVVSRYGSPAEATAADGAVESELGQIIAPVGGGIVRDWRIAPTFGLGSAGPAGDRAILGALDGLSDHARLVAGAWPADSTGPSDPIQVVVIEAVATRLGLNVGDELSLTGDVANQPLQLPARLVGIFAVETPGDAFWGGDQQLLSGVQLSGAVSVDGPLLTTRTDLLARAGAASIHLVWRAFPNFEVLKVEDVAAMRARIQALPGRLVTDTGQTFQMASGLDVILGDAERSLLVSGSGVWLLMAQLALLAGYAIVLTATLLVDHRRVDTALLRSRGAGAFHVALLAFGEGMVLVIPALLLAPWLAVGALGALNVVGPLADVGLRIAPRASTEAYVAAGVGGMACVALLVLPAFLAARAFATEQSAISRQETRTFGQRVGIDLALLAVTAIALWQLRLYGAPLTRTVQGSLGFDPLLVAAPAIGLLAGGVVALRILPLLAQAIESAVSRGRGLVSSLSSRQLARRPLRYTRSALLLMLAVSMGTFAVSYGATWAGSQRDQAAYQAGADIRLLSAATYDRPPTWAMPGEIAGLAGVGGTTPVERLSSGITFGGGGVADLLALDAGTAPGVVLMRADEASQPLAGLMAALRAGRPEPHLAELPAGTSYLRVVPRLQIAAISRVTFDSASGQDRSETVDPASLTGVSVAVGAVIRDGRGLLYSLVSDPVTFGGSDVAVVLPLEPKNLGGRDAGANARLAGPVELAGLSVQVWLPEMTVLSDAVVGVASVSAAGAATGPWSGVPVTTGSWSATMAQGTNIPGATPGQLPDPTMHLTGGGEFGAIIGNGTRVPAAILGFIPSSVGAGVAGQAPLPVVVNETFLSGMATAPGRTLLATVDGVPRELTIVGTVQTFPTTDPARPVVVMDEPTLGLLRLAGTSTVRGPDEWWVAAADGKLDALTASLDANGLGTIDRITVADRTKSLSTDPVALGIIAILSLGFVATGLFAAVALTLSAAVSARQRRTEFALLRALGLSGGQLSGALWLENGSLVVASLFGGTLLGLVIAWLVLPFVTVTQQATTPIPPVLVDVPWASIVLLDAVTAAALGVAVVVLGAALRRLGVGSILRMGED